MDKHIKTLVEKAVRRTGVALAFRAAHRRDILVLAYHNIVPRGQPITGDGSLHLKQHEFARQLDWLQGRYEIVSLSDIGAPRRAHAKPRAVVTFDDAYRGAVTVGVKELVKRDMPATIFIAPGFVGGGTFWWDSVSLEQNGNLPSKLRQYCIDDLAGRNPAIMDWATHNQMPTRAVPDHQAVATEDELATCEASGLITFASHTWSHPNVSRIGEAELKSELERPLEWLEARFRNVLRWLTYPYGLATPAAAAAARNSGYEGALLVSGGSIEPSELDHGRFSLPRTNIPAGLSLDGFVLRTSGIRRMISPMLQQ